MHSDHDWSPSDGTTPSVTVYSTRQAPPPIKLSQGSASPPNSASIAASKKRWTMSGGKPLKSILKPEKRRSSVGFIDLEQSNLMAILSFDELTAAFQEISNIHNLSSNAALDVEPALYNPIGEPNLFGPNINAPMLDQQFNTQNAEVPGNVDLIRAVVLNAGLSDVGIYRIALSGCCHLVDGIHVEDQNAEQSKMNVNVQATPTEDDDDDDFDADAFDWDVDEFDDADRDLVRRRRKKMATLSETGDSEKENELPEYKLCFDELKVSAAEPDAEVNVWKEAADEYDREMAQTAATAIIAREAAAFAASTYESTTPFPTFSPSRPVLLPMAKKQRRQKTLTKRLMAKLRPGI